MIPTTAKRVTDNTAEHVNADIRRRTEASVARCAVGGPQAIDRRLSQLDREWDIERLLETNASLFAFTGVVLGAFVSEWFLLIPAVVTLFLFQHAVQGWCPPLPVFRRLGVRTQTEIDYERYALKGLRGDFRQLPADVPAGPQAAASAVAAATA